MISSVFFNGERTPQMDLLRFRFGVLTGLVDVAEKHKTRGDVAPEKKLAPFQSSRNATMNFNFTPDDTILLLARLLEFPETNVAASPIRFTFRQAKSMVTNIASSQLDEATTRR